MIMAQMNKNGCIGRSGLTGHPPSLQILSLFAGAAFRFTGGLIAGADADTRTHDPKTEAT
jgi:hypothetical protein